MTVEEKLQQLDLKLDMVLNLLSKGEVLAPTNLNYDMLEREYKEAVQALRYNPKLLRTFMKEHPDWIAEHLKRLKQKEMAESIPHTS